MQHSLFYDCLHEQPIKDRIVSLSNHVLSNPLYCPESNPLVSYKRRRQITAAVLAIKHQHTTIIVNKILLKLHRPRYTSCLSFITNCNYRYEFLLSWGQESLAGWNFFKKHFYYFQLTLYHSLYFRLWGERRKCSDVMPISCIL